MPPRVLLFVEHMLDDNSAHLHPVKNKMAGLIDYSGGRPRPLTA